MRQLNANDIQGAIDTLGCEVKNETNLVEAVTESYEKQLKNIQIQIQCQQELVFTRHIEIQTQQKRIQNLQQEEKIIEKERAY